MRSIVQNEITKALHYRPLRIIITLHFILFFLVVLVASRLEITGTGFETENLYRFPHIWQYFPWVASWFNLLLAILVIVLTGNEYAFRTFRQHVIDGMSRFELLAGKIIIILMIGIYSTLMVLLFTLIFGFIYTTGTGVGGLFNKSHILLVYFVQAVAYMSAGFFIVILFRNTALGIILFILYRLVIEPVIRLFFSPGTRLYFPMKVISNLTPTPEFLSISSGQQAPVTDSDMLNLRGMGLIPEDLPVYMNLILAMGYTAVFLFLAYLLLHKRDL
jgi:ABC-type transport system involved in multi-copper enzyme maturation permease subunit